MSLHLRLFLTALWLCALASVPEACAGGAAEAITHSFLATGAKTYIMQFDEGNPQGRVTWEYPAVTREGWVLPNGNILLVLTRGKDHPRGAVIELTRAKEEVWRYTGTQDEVNSIHPTREGTYVLTEAGRNPRLLELDRGGRVLVDFPLVCQTTDTRRHVHHQTRMARKLEDGTYLVPHLWDFAVKQYDRDGKVLHVIDTAISGDDERKIEAWPFTAIRLPNGNTICGLTHANRVAEYDRDGRKVWEITNDDVGGLIKNACGVQRLPNGNTIINNYGARANEVKLFEVTPAKQVVWRYSSPEPAGIHHFHVFDTNGVSLPGPALR